MQEKYVALLGPVGQPTPDGIGAAQSANTRLVTITGPEGEVYSGRSADTVAALDKRVNRAGFDRIGDWVDGTAPLEKMNWLRRNRFRISIPLVSVLLVGGCALSFALDTEEPEEVAGPPSDPLDQMLISFNGGPSKSEIREALDDALNATDTPITPENYSRSGSVLVSFRKDHGIDEMDILECIPTAVEDPRLPEVTFPNVAAVCVTDLVEGVRP